MYPLRHHKSLSYEKWYQYSRDQQILMIANELNRAKNWIEKKSYKEVNLCYERAMELTDLTSSDIKWEGNALRELRRFREVLGWLYNARIKDARFNYLTYKMLIQMDPGAWNLLSGEK